MAGAAGWKQTLKQVRWIRAANAAVTAALQERKAATEQHRYERLARQRGLGDLPPDAIPEAVRARRAARDLPPLTAPDGGLHIFLAYPLANWEAVLEPALSAFGRVTAFEWRSRGFDDRRADWLSQRPAMNAAMLEAFHAARRERPIDVVVGYLSGWNTAPETVREFARQGAAVLNFSWDDKLHYRGWEAGGWPAGPAALASEVDLNLTNAPESVLKYRIDGGLAAFWPEAASAEIHRPYDLPFEYDVAFVGTCYGWRPRLVGALERSEIRVAAFGHGWPAGPLPDSGMVSIYSRSRINLGFGGVGYSRRLLCLKGRDFEVPMAGGLYLTQHNPELERVYRIGEEILTYRDGADCIATIRELLSDPERCNQIREAGRARALADHTWEKRFGQAFRMLGLLPG